MINRRLILGSLALGTTGMGITRALVGSRQAFAAENPLKIGFVYISPIGDAGWVYQHELGRRQMQQALGDKIESKYVENVVEGPDAERVIREFVTSGAGIVFTPSFGYMNQTERVAKQFPNVLFMHGTGYKSNGTNFFNYNARFYEGRYLTGIIAGHMTKSNILGYVAAFPIPEVLQGINALTLAARSVNPKVETRVIWVNSWYDPGKEREAANTLISQGADVVTHHTDSTAVVQAAEDKSVYAFGYHSDMSKYGPKAQLTATTHQWGDYYTNFVKQHLDKSGKPANIWGGIKEGMIKLAPLNPSIPADVVTKITDLENQIRTGALHPFAGPVKDQEGKIRLSSARPGDDELNRMDYYVEGVASKLPSKG